MPSAPHEPNNAIDLAAMLAVPRHVDVLKHKASLVAATTPMKMTIACLDRRKPCPNSSSRSHDVPSDLSRTSSVASLPRKSASNADRCTSSRSTHASQASSVPSTTAKRAREHEHDEHEQDPDLAPRAKLQKTSLSSATDRSNNGRTSSRFHEHDDDDDDDDDDDEMEGAGRQSQKLKLMHQLNQQRQQAKQVKKAPSKFMQLLQEQNLIPYESTDGSKLDHDDLEIARLEKKLSKRDLEIDDGLGGRASLPP